MTTGRWALIIGGTGAGLLAGAAVGMLLLSRYDNRNTAATLDVDDTGTAVPSPRLSLVGIHLTFGELRVRYRVTIFCPSRIVRMDWYLWPFREIREAKPYALSP